MTGERETAVARIVTGRRELAAAYAVRHQVFVVEQGVPVEIERDDADRGAVHALASLRDIADGTGGGEVVATGRLLERDGHAVVGRMAVLPAARGRGAGRVVLRALEEAAVDRGLTEVELHAQLTAQGFYDRCGYRTDGPVFVEAGIDHIGMRRPLPLLRPVRDDDGPALEHLIAACWGEYPGCVLDVDAEEPWLREPASAYARSGGRMWVVELATADGSSELVGCCGLKPGPPAELKNMYVASSARRRGIARRLEALVVAEAVRRGATELVLWSDTRFTEAHAFYPAAGWRRVEGVRELHDLSATIEYPFAKVLGDTPD